MSDSRPLEPIPSSAEMMLSRVIQVSDDWSPTGYQRYFEFVDSLRTNRQRAADLLHQAYDLLSSEQRRGYEGRRLIYLLGHVAHEVSLSLLEEIILEPLPSAELDGHHGGPRSRAEVLHDMALRAMHAIAARYNTPDVVREVYHVLNEVLADARTSPHLALVAADILLTNAEDPIAERARIRSILGASFAHLVDVDVKAVRWRTQ